MIADPPAIHLEVKDAMVTEALLWAIAERETGNRDEQEGGRFRFTKRTWAQVSRQPYRYAQNPRYSIPAARSYIAFIEGQLVRHNYRVSVYFIALSWNAGVSSLWHGHTTLKQKDYAHDVENLYNDRVKNL